MQPLEGGVDSGCYAAFPLVQTSRSVAVTIVEYPDGVPNGYRGLASCSISLPDPNRATATASDD